MNFNYSAEQLGIQEALNRYIEKSYGFEYRRQLARDMTCSREAWAMYAELGLLALPFAESDGGLGGGGVERMLVLQGFGKGLLLEPYVPTVILAGGALALLGSEVQKAMITDIAEGKLLMAFAHQEPESRYCRTHVETSARRTPSGWVLNGRKASVHAAPFADRFLISARVDGAARDPDGISLFLVDAAATGLACDAYGMHDGTCAAELRLQDVAVAEQDAIGAPGQALAAIEQVLDHAVAASCAESLGAMEMLMTLTIEYLQTRKQFGQPIGKFQALRHRAAEMQIRIEQARAMTLQAAVQSDHANAAERGAGVSGAKALIGEAARFVGQQAVQLHGGMGLTDELSVGHYFKRLTMLEAAYGDTDYHLGRYGAHMQEQMQS